MSKLETQINLALLSISFRNPDFWGQIKWACRNASNIAGTYNPNHNAVYEEIRERYVRLGCPFTNTPEQRYQVAKMIRNKETTYEKDTLRSMGS